MRTFVRISIFVFLSIFLVQVSPARINSQTSSEKNTVSVNGIDMYFETTGEGEPLVLLHGFTRSGRDYAPFIEKFSKDYRLIIPDLRGHGRSTNPGGEFTMRQSASDVFALLDHLGIDRFKGIGISAGAVTILHMAVQQPGRVDAAVLIGSGIYYPDACRDQLRMLGGKTYSEAEMNRLRAIHHHGDEQIRSLLRQLGSLANSYEDLSFTPPHLSAVEAAVLIVHGDRDYCFPSSMAEEMYSNIPNAYLWIVPNGGHVPIYGVWFEIFLETAGQFLGGGWER